MGVSWGAPLDPGRMTAFGIFGARRWRGRIGFVNRFRPENPLKTRFFRAGGGPDFRPYHVIPLPPPSDPDLSGRSRETEGGGVPCPDPLITYGPDLDLWGLGSNNPLVCQDFFTRGGGLIASISPDISGIFLIRGARYDMQDYNLVIHNQSSLSWNWKNHS